MFGFPATCDHLAGLSPNRKLAAVHDPRPVSPRLMKTLRRATLSPRGRGRGNEAPLAPFFAEHVPIPPKQFSTGSKWGRKSRKFWLRSGQNVVRATASGRHVAAIVTLRLGKGCSYAGSARCWVLGAGSASQRAADAANAGCQLSGSPPGHQPVAEDETPSTQNGSFGSEGASFRNFPGLPLCNRKKGT